MITSLNEIDAQRFANIRRGAQYGTTIKDLHWLLSLIEKMDRRIESISRRPGRERFQDADQSAAPS